MAAGHDKQKNNLRPAPDPEPPPEEQGQPEIPNSQEEEEEEEEEEQGQPEMHGKNNPALPAPQAQTTRPQRRSRVEFDFRTRSREWIELVAKEAAQRQWLAGRRLAMLAKRRRMDSEEGRATSKLVSARSPGEEVQNTGGSSSSSGLPPPAATAHNAEQQALADMAAELERIPDQPAADSDNESIPPPWDSRYPAWEANQLRRS